ncbi:hypothetical protein [Synechococcus sp. CC9616]|uniref:hypothetical protein n=1 Tax=Synechococcus sp. CC9616 TaxID=110663 RepID=UPI001E51F902|nr:hypothetical protein [Synechococcus sp. CC9616]
MSIGCHILTAYFVADTTRARFWQKVPLSRFAGNRQQRSEFFAFNQRGLHDLDGTIQIKRQFAVPMDHSEVAHDVAMDLPDIEPMPLDHWEGQAITMVQGGYSADWSLISDRKGRYKGCRIRTYQFDFSDESPEPFDGITGEMTVHSRRSKGSLRSTIEMKVDLNDDGRFSKKEMMLSSSREGYKVKDQITDYVSSDYVEAQSLRQLTPNGKLIFQWEEYRYAAPVIQFDNQGKGTHNIFEGYFSDPYAEEMIVC